MPAWLSVWLSPIAAAAGSAAAAAACNWSRMRCRKPVTARSLRGEAHSTWQSTPCRLYCHKSIVPYPWPHLDETSLLNMTLRRSATVASCSTRRDLRHQEATYERCLIATLTVAGGLHACSTECRAPEHGPQSQQQALPGGFTRQRRQLL